MGEIFGLRYGKIYEVMEKYNFKVYQDSRDIV